MKKALLVTLAAWLGVGFCSGPVAASPGGEAPLQVRVHSQDAQRFAALFKAGRLDAEALQRDYLRGAGPGVAIFTPHRIENAAKLAQAVAERRADYAHAIDTCLPLVDSLHAELRAIYLAYRGLLPQARLPAVHLVFGAGNSGGTATPDAQVIGLEVMCGQGTTAEQFRSGMRRIFAHETAHSLQPRRAKPPADLLLYAACMEGVPDLLARIVTGLEPSSGRVDYARGREAEIWQRFEADRAIVRAGPPEARNAAMQRWFGNVGAPLQAGQPEGWPAEMGYWVGMQIAQAYLDRQLAAGRDAQASLQTLLACADPARLLQASGYPPGR